MNLIKKLNEIRERLNKANEMISALCIPKNSKGTREWIMSIPAKPDYDPDLVISASLRDVREMEIILREAYKAMESAIHSEDGMELIEELLEKYDND